MSQAAWKAEQAIGHGDNAVTEQDVTNPALNKERWADPSDKMKALAWMGKNTVEVGMPRMHSAHVKRLLLNVYS